MKSRTLWCPVNMRKIVLWMCHIILLAAWMKAEETQLLIPMANPGHIEDPPMKDRQSEICQFGVGLIDGRKEGGWETAGFTGVTSEQACAKMVREQYPDAKGAMYLRFHECYASYEDQITREEHSESEGAYRSCLFENLEVDCTWNDYADWSACSVTCGDGTRTRTRTEATSAANGGDQCTGGSTETESCNAGSCPDCGSCYGATENSCCNTCADVKEAYDAKEWGYGTFAQCE